MSQNQQHCTACGQKFLPSCFEADFLEKISPIVKGQQFPIPNSNICPACRERQRLAFRNEWSFHRRKCDLTGKDIISIYPAECDYRVYDQEVWWSDKYDPLEYGKEFDFSKTFFQQFHELNLAVPKAAIQNAKSENSIYTNYSWENQNCYMSVGTGNSQDCYYCYRVTHSRDVCDSYDLHKCELCYECCQSTNLYNCFYSTNCHNSSDLTLCENCRGCRNCFGCFNLQQADYHIFNQPVAPNLYLETLQSLFKDGLLTEERYFQTRSKNTPPTNYVLNCENCSGEQLLNCSRCQHCFTLKESQDCWFCSTGENNRDSLDCSFTDNAELQYFSTNLEKNHRVLFCALVWYTDNSAYLLNCFNSSHLFGCSGMKRGSYCILNKQYSERDYNSLLPEIYKHLQETGEWGCFFPKELSPFPYTSSTAGDYYPKRNEKPCSEVISKSEQVLTSRPTLVGNQVERLPDKSSVQTCSLSGKQFRITVNELKLYQKLGLAVPKVCPDVRYQRRMGEIPRAMVNWL